MFFLLLLSAAGFSTSISRKQQKKSSRIVEHLIWEGFLGALGASWARRSCISQKIQLQNPQMTHSIHIFGRKKKTNAEPAQAEWLRARSLDAPEQRLSCKTAPGTLPGRSGYMARARSRDAPELRLSSEMAPGMLPGRSGSTPVK